MTRILENGRLEVSIPYKFRAISYRRRIVLPGEHPPAEEPLVASIARAFRWQQYIDHGRFKNIAELAKAVGQDRALVARTLRLTFLSPKIIHKIVIGEIRNISLAKLRQSVPEVWEDQEKMLMGVSEGKA